jgi:hypothetical protein
MQRLRATALGCLILLAARSAAATSAPTLIGFVGFPAFLSPGSAVAGIVVSPEGGILDEASLALITGIDFPPSTVATSGTDVPGNVYSSNLTITLATPATEFSVQTIGSLISGSPGTITVTAYDGALPVGSDSSDPLLIGDSGSLEDLLAVSHAAGFPSIVFSPEVGGASSFPLDDLSFTPLPEPGSWTLIVPGLFALLAMGRRGRRISG